MKWTISTVWVIACFGFVALWINSYAVHTRLHEFVTPTHRFEISSRNGKLIVLQRRRYFAGVEFVFEYPEDLVRESTSRTPFGIGYHADGMNVVASAPYWLFVLLSAVAAGVPWMSWRFSLRTFLIAVTVVAVLLGALFSGSSIDYPSSSSTISAGSFGVAPRRLATKAPMWFAKSAMRARGIPNDQPTRIPAEQASPAPTESASAANG